MPASPGISHPCCPVGHPLLSVTPLMDLERPAVFSIMRYAALPKAPTRVCRYSPNTGALAIDADRLVVS